MEGGGGGGGLGNLPQLPGLDSEMIAHETTSCRRPHSTFFCKHKMYVFSSHVNPR